MVQLKKILRLTDEERRLLARPAFVAAGIFAFVTFLVITGLSYGLDKALVMHLGHRYHWTEHFFLVLESPGQRRFVYPIAILLSSIFTIRRKDLLPTITTVAALLFTNAVTGVVKIMTLRGFPRHAGPEVFNTDFGDIVDLGSFPSGHAANIAAASTLMVLAAYSARPKFRPYATHITVVTSILCVITFVSSWLRDTHWVTDLFAGLALGVCTTIAATLWALHLPDHWRHPSLAGKPRLLSLSLFALTLSSVFMFAGNSFLSHSGTSALLVVAVLAVIARQSQVSIRRAIRSRVSRRDT